MRWTLFFTLTLWAMTCHAQVVGSWHGDLRVSPTYALPLVLHVSETAEGYRASLDSPDQNAEGIEVDEFSFQPDSLILQWSSKSIGARFQGTLDGGTIKGLFAQRGLFAPLNLVRGEYKKVVEQLPYQVTEVKIPSADVVLSGTLTEPLEGKATTAILLVAGSGPNDRDSKIGPHKPLFDIADYLTREGYAVLRYDKRGVGHSTGTFYASMLSDFEADVEAALSYLRSQGKYQKVGVIGHSEGGLLAQMVAADSPSLVDFIVLLAAPGVNGIETIVFQNQVMMADLIEPDNWDAFGEVTEELFGKIAYHSTSRASDSLLIAEYFDRVLPLVKEERRIETERVVQSEEYRRNMIGAISTPFYKGFLSTDPSIYLPRITCPILALNGSKDMQVEAKRNLAQIKSLATSSPTVTVKELEGLNHLFIPANSGHPSEYLFLPTGVSSEALSTLLNWLHQQHL
nr:alpha/beta hydrolase [uncultured Porphyromonas sp.]